MMTIEKALDLSPQDPARLELMRKLAQSPAEEARANYHRLYYDAVQRVQVSVQEPDNNA